MDLPETSNYEETIERPVYGYLLHNDEQRFEILEKYPNISAKELSITVINSWKSFSEEKKNEYAERAKELNWKCLSEYEKNAHLEHVKELANKLKEARHEKFNDHPNKKSRHHKESDYEQDSGEDASETDDCNTYTYQCDANANSAASTNLSEQPSSVFTHYIIDNTPKTLQYYPKTSPGGIEQVAFNNWSNSSEQHAPSNTESDYEFDDLLNTDEDSEVDESSQSYIQELIHTYNNHKKLQHTEQAHAPSYFHSEPWIQPSKEKDENNIENEELDPISPQCRSEIMFQKDLSVSEEIVPRHCSLFDTQLDIQPSSQENISVDIYDYIPSSSKENTLTDQPTVSKQHNKPLVTQFLVKPYDKENENILPHENTKSRSIIPLQLRNNNVNDVNQNEPNLYKSRSAQFQQDRRYGLKVPVPCITAYEHYQKAVKLDGKNKYGFQTRQTELTKSIIDKWEQMSSSERKIWENKAKTDKARYKKEREGYLTSQYECFLRSQEGIPLNEWLKI